MDDRIWIMTYESLAIRSISWVQYEVLEVDCVVKMGSFALDIWGDWLNKWDVMKTLDKVVEILEEFSMISFTY